MLKDFFEKWGFMPMAGGSEETVVVPEWVASVPFSDETKASETFAKDMSLYKTADDFYKSYRGSQELVGRKGLIIPKEGDAPEIVSRWREGLGIPEKPDGYKITMPEKLHPSIKMAPEVQKNFFEFAHKHGLSNAQAQELNSWYAKDISDKLYAQEKASEEAFKSGDSALRSEWGTNYDLYNAQAEKAWGLFSKGKDKDGKVVDLLDQSSFKDPNVRRVFQLIGSKISEDTFKTMTTQAGGGNEDAKSKIAAINADPKHPYWNADDPKHKEAVNEMLELQKQA